MIRYIVKLFASVAIALSVLLVLDSVRGLTRPDEPAAASFASNSR